MMKYGIIGLILLFLPGFPATSPVYAQTSKRLYIVFDASGSMWGQLPDKSHKITVAREVLKDFVAQDFGDTQLAFRAYGHRRKGDCRDSELLVPFDSAAAVAKKVAQFMQTVNPLGKTPISYSLRQARADLGARSAEIVLITDGIETCDDDPCKLLRQWREEGIDINVHIVGFGLQKNEKAALECIAEASGTRYYDAESALDLSRSLSEIQAVAIADTVNTGPGNFEGRQTVGLWLQGIDTDGNSIRVEGFLKQNHQERFLVSSEKRNQVDAGNYHLVAGVRTANGNLYRPKQIPVTVSGVKDTVVQIKVVAPPSVKARFSEGDETRRGALIHAYQEDKEVFTFRWFDEVFVDEGTYEFRTKPNLDNDLKMTETLVAGDQKELVFEMRHTVHAYFKMFAKESGTRLRGNVELWQEGALKYKVHAHNGAAIRPGRYDVQLINKLNPHVESGVIVSADVARQEIKIPVPSAHVTFVYQKADGSRDNDKRVFLGRGEEKHQVVRQSGQQQVLLPGTYNVVGWKGDYRKVVFQVTAGEHKEIILRQKE